jgi:hypothetical protein
MGGARERAGAFLKQWGKWGLVALALLAMPFCWSFGRDSWAIAIADDETRFDIHLHLVHQLLDADTYATEIRERSLQPLTSMAAPTPCFVYPTSAVRPNPELRGEIEPAPERLPYYPQLYIDGMSDQVIRFGVAVDRFSPHTASALRACIESTPFGHYCARYRNDALERAVGDIDERRVAAGTRRRILLMRRYSRQNYCTTLPMPVE